MGMGKGTLHIIVYRRCKKVHANLQIWVTKGGFWKQCSIIKKMCWSEVSRNDLDSVFRFNGMKWNILVVHVYTVFNLHSFIKKIQITKDLQKKIIFKLHICC